MAKWQNITINFDECGDSEYWPNLIEIAKDPEAFLVAVLANFVILANIEPRARIHNRRITMFPQIYGLS